MQGQLLQVSLTTHAVTNTANFVPSGGQVGGGVWTSPTLDVATNTIFVSTGTINQYTQNLAQAIVVAGRDHTRGEERAGSCPSRSRRSTPTGARRQR